MRKLFTSESVTEGHPDKLCDQVSDAVLDALLAQDPMSRVACETCATTGMVMVMGEITTTAKVDIPAIVRDVVLDIGYNDSSLCFDGNTCAVLTSIHAQSPDIAMGVDDALETRTQDANEIGAGDQGMMFGFACDETPEYMPTAIAFAHRLTRRLLQLPYDILNRINRRKLLKANTDLTSSIRMEDYRICPVSDDCFDLFYVAEK